MALLPRTVFSSSVNYNPVISYDLLDENCEGTGTPSGWVDSGTPSWDYTTVVLQGAQSLLCGGGSSTYKTFTAQSTAYAYCLFRIPAALPGAVTSYCALRDTDGTARAIVRVNATGQVTIFANGSDSTACVTTMAADTTYHVWWSFTASGTCTVAFSTDGIRPTSGNNFTSKTGSAGTVGRFTLSFTAIYDRLLVSTTQIGNSP